MIDINGDTKYSFWATVILWVCIASVTALLTFQCSQCSRSDIQKYYYEEGVKDALKIKQIQEASK